MAVALGLTGDRAEFVDLAQILRIRAGCGSPLVARDQARLDDLPHGSKHTASVHTTYKGDVGSPPPPRIARAVPLIRGVAGLRDGLSTPFTGPEPPGAQAHEICSRRHIVGGSERGKKRERTWLSVLVVLIEAAFLLVQFGPSDIKKMSDPTGEPIKGIHEVR
jgi:hypothetical protein